MKNEMDSSSGSNKITRSSPLSLPTIAIAPISNPSPVGSTASVTRSTSDSSEVGTAMKNCSSASPDSSSSHGGGGGDDGGVGGSSSGNIGRKSANSQFATNETILDTTKQRGSDGSRQTTSSTVSGGMGVVRVTTEESSILSTAQMCENHDPSGGAKASTGNLSQLTIEVTNTSSNSTIAGRIPTTAGFIPSSEIVDGFESSRNNTHTQSFMLQPQHASVTEAILTDINGTGTSRGGDGLQLEQTQQQQQNQNQTNQLFFPNQQALSPSSSTSQQHLQANDSNDQQMKHPSELSSGSNTLQHEIHHIDNFEGIIISPRAKDEIVEKSPGGRYLRFSEKLGSGAYKDVYRAYDTSEGIEVAWNVVNLCGVPKLERQYIVNEVRLLEKLNHSNIISFHGSWVNRELERVIFVTEILSSGTLKQFINKVQIIRYKIAKRWAIQILKGLEYLHSQDPSIIHRDLKCDNIFINGTSGDLRIGDLGLSTVINKKSKALSVLGTPEFMAPELYDEAYDEKVDIYAFGMCMLEIFTKEIPYKECSNPAQIYKRVTNGIEPQSLCRIRSENAQDFIRQCLGMKDDDGNLIRPSASELLSHPFLAKRETDSNEIAVEPSLRERAIREEKRSGVVLPTVNTEPRRQTSSGSDRTSGIKKPLPSPIDNGSSAKNTVNANQTLSGPQFSVHARQPSFENKEIEGSVLNKSPANQQNVLGPQHQHNQSFDFDSMPDSETNMKHVKVLMGRGQEVDASNGRDHLPIPIQKEVSPPVSTGPSPHPSPHLQQPSANYQEPIPAHIFTNDDGRRQIIDGTNERRQFFRTSSNQGSLGSQGNPLRYLRMAVILDENKSFPIDIMQLRLSIAVGSEEQQVQFGFHLVQDDAVQVAREMVTELQLPNDAILEISETISAMARQARMQQGQYKANEMLQLQQGVSPRPLASNKIPTMPNQFQFNTPNYCESPPDHSLENSVTSLLNESQISILALGDPSVQSSVPVAMPPQMNSIYTVQHQASSSQCPPIRRPSLSGMSITSQNSNGNQTAPNVIQSMSAPQLFVPPTMLDTTIDLQEGDSEDDEDELGNSVELKQLKEELKKKKSRAQKAFHTRMGNLQRSKEEKEAQHLKSLEKHEKESAALEKRLKMAEEEQYRRLEKLEQEFVEQVAEQSKKLIVQQSVNLAEPIQQLADERESLLALEARLKHRSLDSMPEINSGGTGSNPELFPPSSPTGSDDGLRSENR